MRGRAELSKKGEAIKIFNMHRLFILFFFLLPCALAQFVEDFSQDLKSQDLTVGGDIFNDFNENLEAKDVLEDERFLRYGRYFAINIGLGVTDFSGNRGLAYENYPPTINFSLMAFSSFQNSFVLGLSYSKHSMYFPGVVNKDPHPLALVEINMFRTYIGFRYYIDTSNLNTAFTYSTPYLSMRFENWYVVNQYTDRPTLSDDSGNGLGVSFGGGLEFPIHLKRSYINYEFLAHVVNYHDRFTNLYQDTYQDLGGVGFSNVINYVINW